MEPISSLFIGKHRIALDSPTYFIADIAANHDGDLERAKELIWLAKESGANAAKFQHFKANQIVSDFGFRALGNQLGHQSKWNKSVFEVYQAYELNRSWNEELATTANAAGIDFMTTPYDYEAVEQINSFVLAYKIGSGDITWIDFIQYIAKIGKPILLATGASDIIDVKRAIAAILEITPKIILMQCNTNYTGSLENFRFINLNVLKTYTDLFSGILLGLSDHSPGHATVLGAIALGARVIEKHFTDDNNRLGPDHNFAMNPKSWSEMIERSRELEAALGDGIKRIEENEKETVILQRRCIRLTRNINANDILEPTDLSALRPAPIDSINPYDIDSVIGKKIHISRPYGDALKFSDLEEV